MSFTLRVNDARLTNWPSPSRTALRSVCCAPARSSPRTPATPDAGPLNALTLEVIGPARPPRQSLRVVARRPRRRRTSERWRAPRRSRCARGPVTPAAWLGPSAGMQPSSPVKPTAIPLTSPRPSARGTCGGSSSGGPGDWLTASAAFEHHPSPTPSREGRDHAHPPPARGRERGSQVKDQFSGKPEAVPGWSFWKRS